MTYFKSLLFNCLTVFFVDHVIPGIDILKQTKLPHIEGDLIFAFALGLINSLIFPILKLFQLSPSYFRIGITSFIVTFGVYAILNFLPLQIKVHTLGAYFWASLIVWFFAYLTNGLEFRRFLKKQEPKED